MSRPCDACPCPDTCLRWPAFCEWAAADPPDPVHLRHIRARSGGPAYPSLAQQASNLAGSFWSWAVSGFSAATEEEQARRLAICQTCPQYDVAAIRCHLCGCYLAAKVAMKAEHCPLPEPKW